MFNKLKEKFSGWLKKKPAEDSKEPKKPKPGVEEVPPVETPKSKKEKPKKPTEEVIKEEIKELPKKVKEKPTTKEESKLTSPTNDEQANASGATISKDQASDQELGRTPKSETQKPTQVAPEKPQSTPKPKPETPEPKPEPPEPTTVKTQEPPFPEPEAPQSTQGFFTKLKTKLTLSVLTKEQFEEIFPDLEITLLENNVALEAVDKIKESLEKDLVGISIKKSEIESTILNSLKEAITSTLIEPPNLLDQINKSLGTFTIIFVGINGSGKTTSLAKLAHFLKQNNISCCLAAADTFRAASIEQLQKHADNLSIPIIKHDYGSDPAAVAFDAKKYAKQKKIKVVLIDTAGRMYTKANLIKEMEKIVRVSSPDLKIFVGESITGNDAIEQAKTFNEAIDIDGIILSKADIDEKAGTILSVSQVTNKPIYFLGTGQNYEDLTPFSKETVLKNLGLE